MSCLDLILRLRLAGLDCKELALGHFGYGMGCCQVHMAVEVTVFGLQEVVVLGHLRGISQVIEAHSGERTSALGSKMTSTDTQKRLLSGQVGRSHE